MSIDGGEKIKVPVHVRSECSGTTVEIKIKTLDSQTFSLRVDKCVPVPELKRQVASLTGVLSEQQRLICRGRVLKDDQLLSAYHVEDGHTLHLVVRQPIASFQAASTDAGESDGQFNIGDHSGSGTFIRTFSLLEDGDGDGDGAFPDLNHILSAVFDTVGFTRFGSVAGSDLQHSPSELLSTAPRSFPSDPTVSAAPPDEPPTIPDSLSTLSQYLSHLTREFIAHDGTPPVTGLPVNSGFGLGGILNSTEFRRPFLPESLAEVLLSTRELLLGQASDCLQRLAGHLESQSNMTDHLERSRIQSSAFRSGVLFQNLGALFLELGRATMTLRMGRTASDALINAGPPFFISASGPNQIMVQSAPVQVGAIAGSVPLGVVPNGTRAPAGLSGSGLPTRNFDIRIRTGAFMPRREPSNVQTHGQVATSTGSSQQDAALNNNNSGSRDSNGRPLPARNIVGHFTSTNRNGADSPPDPLGTFHPLLAVSHHTFSTIFNGSGTSQATEQHGPNSNNTHTNPNPQHGNSVIPGGNGSSRSGNHNSEGFEYQIPNVGHEQLGHANDDNNSYQSTTESEAKPGCSNEGSASINIDDDAVLLSHVLHHMLPMVANISGIESSSSFAEGTNNDQMQGIEHPSLDTSSRERRDLPKDPSPKRRKLD